MKYPEFKNIVLVIKDQLPWRRLFRNLKKGHLLGIISKRSHLRDNGKAKVMYNTKETATKVALQMSDKHGKHFSNYKCLWCNGYHIGKNRENKNNTI